MTISVAVYPFKAFIAYFPNAPPPFETAAQQKKLYFFYRLFFQVDFYLTLHFLLMGLCLFCRQRWCGGLVALILLLVLPTAFVVAVTIAVALLMHSFRGICCFLSPFRFGSFIHFINIFHISITWQQKPAFTLSLNPFKLDGKLHWAYLVVWACVLCDVGALLKSTLYSVHSHATRYGYFFLISLQRCKCVVHRIGFQYLR